MKNKKSKREVIIYSALKMFEKDGFHKTKVEEIAKGANVGKGTIYEYFDSKRDLFCQMIKYMMDQYIKIIRQIAEEDVDAITKLYNLLKTQLKLTKKHGNFGDMIHVEIVKNGIGKDIKPLFIEFRKKYIYMITEIIEEGIKSGLFKKVDASMAALFFIGGCGQFTFEQSFMKVYLGEYNNETESDVEAFINAFLDGLRK